MERVGAIYHPEIRRRRSTRDDRGGRADCRVFVGVNQRGEVRVDYVPSVDWI